MNLKNSLAVLFLSVVLFSCKQTEKKNQTANSTEQQELVFQKGELIENNNFTGDAWLEMLVDADRINQNSVGSVTF